MKTAEPAVTRPANHRATIEQIGFGARLNLGARDFVHDDANGYLMFRIGSGRSVRKARIWLDASDTYAVEIGRMHRRTYEWIVEATATYVYADQLANTLLTLHGKATS